MTEQGATESPLAASLAAFQAKMPTVHKGKTANMGTYSYKYADLADVAQTAHPLLAEHGLSFHAVPTHIDGVGFVLQGVLRHMSGETVTGMLPLVGRDAQAIGSSLTYNRRYLLGCMTGIVTDDDDDGARAARARDERPTAVSGQRAAQATDEIDPIIAQAHELGRDAILHKLDEACEALGKSRAELTKKWRDAHNVGAVKNLEDESAVPTVELYRFVLTMQPYVQQARERAAREPHAAEHAAAAGVLCTETKGSAVCTRAAGHDGDHEWWGATS